MGLFREVTVTVGQDGKIEIEVNGVTGPACLDITKSLQKALGKLESCTKKAEYYQSNQKQTLTQKQT